MPLAGTRPSGTSGEEQAARYVERMFSGIAPRYDLLNHLLSFNIDKRWRKALLASLSPVLDRKNARVLDLCCGTGDVLIDLQSCSSAKVLGADFCFPMLAAAQTKLRRRQFNSPLAGADAMHLPFADDSLDGISIAFGFRNLVNYAAALEEFERVLKTSGSLAILEFSHPPNPLMRAAYGFYSRMILPVVGGLISGSRSAYTYLPESVRKFPTAETLRNMMASAGFRDTKFVLLTGGVAALHVGVKS